MRTTTTILLLILVIFVSCSHENVKLDVQWGMDKEDYTYYKAGTDILYSGEYTRSTEYDKVTIDFKEGKIDGDFVRSNKDGDTMQYIKYKNGHRKFEIDFQYEGSKVIYRNEVKHVKGSQEDKKIFEKVISLIFSKEYRKMDDYLNPLFQGHYETQFNNYTKHFGSLKSIEIIDIRKEIYPFQKREDVRAKMLFNYEDIQLNTKFLIVKKQDGELTGQAFTRRPLPFELLPDKKIEEVIDILIKKDVDRFLSIKHLDSKHREEVEDLLSDFGEIASTYTFLNTKPFLNGPMVYLKSYLVEIDGEKQVLTLKYNVVSKDELDLRLFYFTEYRRPFVVGPGF